MSTDVSGVPAPSTLAEFIASLVRELRRGDRDAFDRLTEVVGERSACIVLGAESARVRFRRSRLTIGPCRRTMPPVNTGITDRRTVLDILDGEIETSDALFDDRIQIYGAWDDVALMFIAIEILLDASARLPRLVELGDRFRSLSAPEEADVSPRPQVHWYPFDASGEERRILFDLKLLPTEPESP